MGLAPPIGNLVGKLEFTEKEINDTQRGLDASGLKLPNFSSVGAHFGSEQTKYQYESEPESECTPEPEISEEELLLYELTEHELEIIELQAISKGALLRLSLYTDRYILSKSANQITKLQAIIRGSFFRNGFNKYAKSIQLALPCITTLQSIARGKLDRIQLGLFKHEFEVYAPEITELQSLIRGKKYRFKKHQVYSNLYKNENINQIINLQSIIRKKQLKKHIQQMNDNIKTSINDNHISKLQAKLRGKELRNHFLKLKNDLRRTVPDVMELQALVRGALLRNSLSHELEDIGNSEPIVLNFQSLIRGSLVRRKFAKLENNLSSDTLKDLMVALQSSIRGFLTRKSIEHQKLELIRFRHDILFYQATVRGVLFRKHLNDDFNTLFNNQDSTCQVQSLVRGKLYRARLNKFQERIEKLSPLITNLQTDIRSRLVRSSFKKMQMDLFETSLEYVALQSIIRGNFKRTDFNHKKSVLSNEEYNIMELQSVYRAGMVRTDLGFFLNQLDLFSPAVVRLQSLFRGVIARFQYSLILEEFDEELESIIALQALCRGNLIRKAHQARIQYFKENMEKIIKIQSFVRAKKQGDSYKSLVSSPNPPLSTVKNFVHLLNDSDLDFEQEVQLEQSRKQVIDEIHHNEQLEQFIQQLDVKIALLLKNKITIDEVIRHRNRGFNGHISVTTPADMFDLKAINKSSRKRLELYQGFFYIIQTNPIYLSQLFKKLQRTIISEKEAKEIETMTMTVFGGSSPKRREEYFLLKLISSSIVEETSESHNIKSVLRGNFMWWKLITALNRGPKERKTLKTLLYSSVMTVVNRPDLDLESDPLAIYRKSISNEEMRTGQLSQRNPNISVNEAIRDPETRSTYISNMQRLRDITSEFLNTVTDNIDMIPYHIRFAAKELYNACKHQFESEKVSGSNPEKAQQQKENRLLSLVGHVLFNLYLNPAITAADNYGIIETALSPVQTRNLTEISKMLSQVSMLRPFSREDVYLQPLNDYIKESISLVRDVFKRVMNIEELGQHYHTSMYDDITSHIRPTLYIKTSDIFSIHSLIFKELDDIAPDVDDPLRSVVSELGTLPNDASEILNIAKFTEIKLELNPSFCQIEDPEAEVNSLLVSTKRCLIYVLRVQSGANLMDVLVAPVEPFHEEKYRTILAEEKLARERKKKRKLEERRKSLAATKKTLAQYNPYLPISATNVPPNQRKKTAEGEDEVIEDVELEDDKIETAAFGANEHGLGDLNSITYSELKRLTLEKVLQLEAMGKVSRHDQYQSLLNSIAFDIKSKRDRRAIRAQEMETVKHTLQSLADKENYLQTKLKTYSNYIEQAMLTLQTKKGQKRKPLLPFSTQFFHMRDLQRANRVPKFGSYKYTASNMYDKGVLVEIKGYTDKQYDKIFLTWSSDEVGVFKIEALFGSVRLPGAITELTLDELLSQQYNNKQYITLFDQTTITLNTNLTLHFIFKKFYGESL